MYTSEFFTVSERDWSSLGFIKKGEKNITSAVYSKIVKHANKNNLEIIKVSNVEDGRYGTAGASAIFREK